MRYRPSFVPLVEEARLYEASGVFGDRLRVAIEKFGDAFQGEPVVLAENMQYLQPPMIRRTLEVSFQLSSCFHAPMLTRHSDILKNVGMS